MLTNIATTSLSTPHDPILENLYLSHTVLNISLTTFLFPLGTLILILNSLLCHYYLTKTSKVVYDRLFLLLAAVDAVTGVAGILQCASFAATVADNHAITTLLLPATALLSSTAFHTSAFYNVLLAVCRTLTLHSPFFTFNMDLLYTAAGAYPLLWASLGTYEIYSVYRNERRVFDWVNLLQIAPLCGSEVINNTTSEDFPDWAYYVILLGIPYVLPSIICCVCCCISLHSLRPCDGSTDNQGIPSYIAARRRKSQLLRLRQNRNFRATITILQLSTVFFVCNTLFFTTEFTLALTRPQGTEQYENYIVYTVGTLLPLLNSLINPAILIRRGTKLKNFVYRLVKDRKMQT